MCIRDRGVGGDDRRIDRCQGRRDQFAPTTQQLCCSTAQRASGAPAAFVELVLCGAVGAYVRGAEVRGRSGGAVRADGCRRPGRVDKPALLMAAGAGAPTSQRRGVAGVTDRALGPAGCRRTLVSTVRAGRRGPWGALGADRVRAGSERARPALLAAAADRLRHLETGDADIGKPIAAAPCDPAGPPALPAWPLRAVLAAGTNRPVVLAPTCERFDDSAARAGHGQLAAPAPWAHPTAIRAGQWLAAACTPVSYTHLR